MTTEFNELLPNPAGDKPPEEHPTGDRAQVWLIGSREQVTHLINEFYLKRITDDRIKFTPIVPAPFAAGKYMSVLVR